MISLSQKSSDVNPILLGKKAKEANGKARRFRC